MSPVRLSLFFLLLSVCSGQLFQFPSNVPWADLQVEGELRIIGMDDARPAVTGSIQYLRMATGIVKLHTDLQVDMGIIVPLESWIITTPQKPIKIASQGNIPGMAQCEVVNLPSSAMTCNDWQEFGSRMIDGHNCDYYLRSCTVSVDQQMLLDYPSLSMFQGQLTMSVYMGYPEPNQPYYLVSNISSAQAGQFTETAVFLHVTSVSPVPPLEKVFNIPTDCH
eukprot:TRINITY_DN5572_c0_g2_i5.p1 TRINITY_DN5572_c0_g2~~TRINITY_DN5572_c0_g2_i5.p1  ORF type:complete len:245 (-),score=14.54 TRINITY_DN5572_c0_g2_i5:379-1044(-)